MDSIKNLLMQIKELLYDLVTYIKKDTFEKVEVSKKEEIKREQKPKEELYVDEERLILVNKETELSITLNEALLLREFLKEKEALCTYERLCKVLYGCELDDYALNSLRITVFRLKKKVNGILRIKNIRNKGFIAYEVKSNG